MGESKRIRSFRELRVYQSAFSAAMLIFEASKTWPTHERRGLTDQIRRSSRSVCGCTVEAWRKRRSPAAFAAKLNDAEAEAAETRVWLDFARECGYLGQEGYHRLDQDYDRLLGQFVRMIQQPDQWALGATRRHADPQSPSSPNPPVGGGTGGGVR